MTKEETKAISSALHTLRNLGCTAHEDDSAINTWDVEFKDGSWEGANSIAELTAIAKKVVTAAQNPGVYRDQPL